MQAIEFKRWNKLVSDFKKDHPEHFNNEARQKKRKKNPSASAKNKKKIPPGD